MPSSGKTHRSRVAEEADCSLSFAAGLDQEAPDEAQLLLAVEPCRDAKQLAIKIENFVLKRIRVLSKELSRQNARIYGKEELRSLFLLISSSSLIVRNFISSSSLSSQSPH